MPPPLHGLPWSEMEDAYLALYLYHAERDVLRAALPHRTRDAIRVRALTLGVNPVHATSWTPPRLAELAKRHKRGASQTELAKRFGVSRVTIGIQIKRLGLQRRNMWTREELCLLRNEWQELTPRTLARRLKRHTWQSIMDKAGRLGLGRAIPQGFESLHAAAKRTNYLPATLRRLLDVQGVEARRVYGRKRYTIEGRNAFYDPDEVNAAIARELRLESIEHAATRHSVARNAMMKWLRAAGVTITDGRRMGARVDPTSVDALMEARSSLRAMTMTVREAATRYGVVPSTMARWLRAAGVRTGEGRALQRVRSRLSYDDVDRAARAALQNPRTNRRVAAALRKAA